MELKGLFLFGALVAAYLVGGFTWQYVTDWLKGVPSSLRTALKGTETNALAKLRAAEQKAIADVTGLLPAAPAPAAPVVAAPATPAAAPAATVKAA